MKNRDIYQRDPSKITLLNNGVATMTDALTDDERRTLRFELEHFVCEGEYQRGLVRILDSYVSNQGQPEQPAAWVSGFFGSGKSHLAELQKRLVAILEGEPPFDIFVRWKSIEEQPIGWDPDINDGVRVNIRPFMAQDLPGGKKGAGILRVKPNIHWKKDRGKEPTRDQAQFPWSWKNGKFTGERVNDVHLTNAEKRTARQRMQGDTEGGGR